jgi:hypothetical protein
MENLSKEEEKLAELILYVSGKCLTHERFGATKLNKILFFSDFVFFKLHGKPITGVPYFKLENGPAPRCLIRVRESLQKDEALVIAPRFTTGGFVQHRPIPMRAPDLKEFSADEISIVDQVIDFLKDKSAEEVSELSHYYVIGWKMYELKEEIPYHSVFARAMKEEHIKARDIQRAKEIATKQKLPDATP